MAIFQRKKFTGSDQGILDRSQMDNHNSQAVKEKNLAVYHSQSGYMWLYMVI